MTRRQQLVRFALNFLGANLEDLKEDGMFECFFDPLPTEEEIQELKRSLRLDDDGFAPTPNGYILALDEREMDSVLAGLRCWQDHLEGESPNMDMLREIASNAWTHKPLNEAEIGFLCERLNCGG